MTDRAKQWTKRILDGLHRHGRRQYGAISRAEKAVGRASGYLRGRREAGTIDVPHCLALMDALGVHPARFFRQVFPFTGDEVSCYLDPPRGNPPAIIACAHERLASTRPASIPRAHLVELDALRYDCPTDAARGAAEALPYIDPADVPLALGVWGSAQRWLLELDHAAHAFFAGMKMARQQDARVSFGDLLQRAASIAGDCGDFMSAFALAREATDWHLLGGDMVAVGRTIVDRGVWLYYLEKYDAAITMQERALADLPPSERRHRLAALQVLGLCYQKRGKLDTAQQFSEQALAEADGLGGSLKGKQAWLQASICFDRGALDEAELLLQEVIDLFANIHAGDTALATIDLAEVQLKANRPAAAYRSALAILPLITPLGARSRIVRAAEFALRELASRGVQGVTFKVVEDLRRAIEAIRGERHLWRSLLRME